MKKYCVDLKIAKELDKNGFPQKTLFYWYDTKFNGNIKPDIREKHFSTGPRLTGIVI